jgi:alpha-amylase/alpha-mannosidase (GH57 family)
MKELYFSYKKTDRGWIVYFRTQEIGRLIRLHYSNRPWAKFLIEGDPNIYREWFARRDDAAFELYLRKVVGRQSQT